MQDDEFLMQVEFAIYRGTEPFRDLISSLTAQGLSGDQFEALIGYLEDLPERDPAAAMGISQVMLELFDGTTNAHRYGLIWHFRMLSLLQKPDPELIIKSLKKALDYCSEDSVNQSCGHMICQNVKGLLSLDIVGEDSLLLVDKLIIDFYRKMDMPGEALTFMLHAATVFSRSGASQSAYRMLNEAEEMTAEAGRKDLHIKVMSAIAQAAMDEGDHEYALKVYDDAFEDLRASGLPIPVVDQLNYALIKMRLDHTAEALALFTGLLSQDTPGIPQSYLQYHMGICQKDLGKWELAEAQFEATSPQIAQTTTDNEQQPDPYQTDLIIDFSICYALILATNGKFTDAIKQLKIAIDHIEKNLLLTIRPHFRRAIRQRYHNRILQILELIWPEAAPADVLPVLLYLKKNSQSDWLAVLNWAQSIQKTEAIAATDKQRLGVIMERLHDHSGMVIGHFLEKYDDPFEYASRIDNIFSGEETATSRVPWQDLGLFADELAIRYGTLKPFTFNRLELLEQAAGKKIASGMMLMFSFLSKEGFAIYIFSGTRIYRKVAEIYDLRHYHRALLDYRQGGRRKEFTPVLNDTIEMMDEILAPIWPDVDHSLINGIYLFPGVLDAFLPLAQACLYRPEIRERMSNGDFALVQCPVMFPGDQASGPFEKIEVLINEEDSLDLFGEEAQALKTLYPKSNIRVITDDSDIRKDIEAIRQADAVHLITHGTPVSDYRDPVYARLSPQAFSLLALKAFHDSRHRLYLLNSCNAADTVSGNRIKVIPSNDLVGFITVLLQNRMGMVIAPQWPLMDTLGYIFSLIFYQHLLESNDIIKAFSKTIGALSNENTAYFAKLLEQITDNQIKKKKLDLISKSEKPFDSIYLYGSFNLYSLL